jgi:hypothetical protein
VAVTRVVAFDGVGQDRIEEIRGRIESGDAPEGLPAKEILVLHDPDAEKALVVLFFDSDEDYAKGDEILSAMPAEDTPGERSSVTKYQVAARMTV